jgi:hypothetical protein
MRTLARFHRQVQAFQRWGPERRGRPDRLDQDTVAIDSRHPAARQHFARDRNLGVEVLRCHQALRKRGGGAVGEWAVAPGSLLPPHAHSSRAIRSVAAWKCFIERSGGDSPRKQGAESTLSKRPTKS